MKRLFLNDAERADRPTVVCLGFFDGVHRGHARLVERALEIAAEKDLAVCVHTFDQMPVRVLQPEANVLELTPLEEKASLLAALGVDILAVSRFDHETMHQSAGEFFHHVLLEALQARHIVAGFHHRFGYHGEGDTATLYALSEKTGTGLDVIAPVTLENGELISSTAIRTALAQGNTDKAQSMLGRTWNTTRLSPNDKDLS